MNAWLTGKYKFPRKNKEEKGKCEWVSHEGELAQQDLQELKFCDIGTRVKHLLIGKESISQKQMLGEKNLLDNKERTTNSINGLEKFVRLVE